MLLFRRGTDWQRPYFRSPFFEEFNRMQRELDRLSESLSKGVLREEFAGVFPLVNVTEDSDSYFIRAELPVIKADEIDISVTSNTISISGERKIATEGEGARYHRRERESGNFSRILTLPGQINAAKVEAAKPRKISVKAS
jgi:HSP20 family protein